MSMRLRFLPLVLTMITSALMTNAGDNLGDEVSRGTINVALANQHGIVVLTDSMVTRGGHQLAAPAQKLFRLNDRTVCAIAGFLAAPGPSDLYIDSSALMHEYTRQLSSRPPQTIREELTSLAFLFKFELSAIASIRAGTGLPTDLQKYESQLTIAGYDIDGVARIGQITLWTVASGNSLSSEVLDESIEEVGKRLVYKLAGEPDVAESLLHDPALAIDDAALAAYATSLRQDQGESLTVPQMKALASRLAEYTAQKYPSVGGDNQVAVLQDGRVLNVEQPAFPSPPKSLVSFSIVVDSSMSASGPPMSPPMSEGPILFPSGMTLLFLRTRFNHVRRKLDGNYFFDNRFNDCILQYNGGPFYFDKNNQVTHTALFLGPDAKIDEPRVQELLHNFQWFGTSIAPK
jgi:20S proteasome alpha/beta subunit